MRAHPDAHRLTAFRVSLFGAPAATQPPPPPTTEQRWELLVAGNDRYRAAFADTTVIVDGATWTWWRGEEVPRSNAGDPQFSHGLGPGEDLLDPVRYLPALDIGEVAAVTTAGRAAHRLQVMPREQRREGDGFSLHGLGTGADAYVLDVDAELGVLLRVEALLNAEPLRIIEVDRCEVDVPIGDALTPPAGAAPARGFAPSFITLPEAIERASFDLYLPAAGDPPFRVVWHDDWHDGGGPAAQLLFFAPSGSEGPLSLTELPADAPGAAAPTEPNWQPVSYDDGPVVVREADGETAVQVIVGGTAVQLVTERAREDALRWLLPLRPAGRQSP